MFPQSLITVTILANAVFGSFCMMPMAQAQTMPMQQEADEDMNMTPMVPMSPAHCEHCTHVTQRSVAPMDGGCAGHCVAKAQDALAGGIAVSSASQISAALPPAFPWLTEPAEGAESTIASRAPPINLVFARNVVLIQ